MMPTHHVAAGSTDCAANRMLLVLLVRGELVYHPRIHLNIRSSNLAAFHDLRSLCVPGDICNNRKGCIIRRFLACVSSTATDSGGTDFPANDPSGTGVQIMGLAVITASCAEVSNPANPAENIRKWKLVVGAPMVLTVLVYAVADRSKFQGYSSAASAPLSSFGDGSFGIAEFDELLDEWSPQHWFYVCRTFLSITINISSILLVLIDAVCLEVGRVFISERSRLTMLSHDVAGFRMQCWY